jgi:hypothetical protein
VKKLIRYSFPLMVASSLLSFMAYTPTVLEVLTGQSSIFNGHLTAYNMGHTLGILMRWVAYLALAKIMWSYRRQWAQPAQLG